MKIWNKNRGITLIALVVTIVVLLILAGISVSMLTGQNGILNKAAEAKEKTEISSKDEQRKLAQAEALINTEKTTYKGVTFEEYTKIESDLNEYTKDYKKKIQIIEMFIMKIAQMDGIKTKQSIIWRRKRC